MECPEWIRKRVLALLIPIFGTLGFVLFVFCFSNTIQNASHRSTASSIALIKGQLPGTPNSSEIMSPFDETWQKLIQLECAKLFDEDETYTNKMKKERIVLEDPAELDIKCDAIRSRWNFPELPNSAVEAEYPIAFARTVFKDYLFLEQMLSVEYQPQNFYCYSLDKKSNKIFKKQIRNLQKCFNNVIVNEKEYSVFSNGKNVTRSHLECLKTIFNHSNSWKYVFLLQNHDVSLKTNLEKVEILKILNGTNDISTVKIMPISVNKKQNWTFADLKLYKNGTRNFEIKNNTNSSKVIYHTKSLNLVTLSYSAVDFVLNQLNTGEFIDRLETAKYGMDEVFFSTLNSNLEDMPGGYTYKCLKDESRLTKNIGRYALWQHDTRCKSRKFRHDVCIFGMEDLAHLDSGLFPFYFNKMMPIFDYGAIFCWLQKLVEVEPSSTRINSRYYSNLAHVKFNRLKSQKLINGSDDFKCL